MALEKCSDPYPFKPVEPRLSKQVYFQTVFIQWKPADSAGLSGVVAIRLDFQTEPDHLIVWFSNASQVDGSVNHVSARKRLRKIGHPEDILKHPEDKREKERESFFELFTGLGLSNPWICPSEFNLLDWN